VNEKTQMKVTLLGTSLMVQSDDKEEQLQSIVNYFEKKIDEVKKKLPTAEPLKIAIIAALNIIDELFKIQAAQEQRAAETNDASDAEEVEKITRNMIQKIDSILQ
jgi:cell division protein ZapA